jgi:hypothetical protein
VTSAVSRKFTDKGHLSWCFVSNIFLNPPYFFYPRYRGLTFLSRLLKPLFSTENSITYKFNKTSYRERASLSPKSITVKPSYKGLDFRNTVPVSDKVFRTIRLRLLFQSSSYIYWLILGRRRVTFSLVYTFLPCTFIVSRFSKKINRQNTRNKTGDFV